MSDSTSSINSASSLMLRPVWRVSPPWDSFIAGAVGGGLGAVITAPLDLVRTRLQSSLYKAPITYESTNPFGFLTTNFRNTAQIIRNIVQTEGYGSLWKGVGPNLVGVIPSRALYFFSYNLSKDELKKLNGGKEGTGVHFIAAVNAGIVISTAMNPIWVIKTRIQLKNSQRASGDARISTASCIRAIYKEEGFFGFYRGLQASYIGIAEGTLQWILYEKMKAAFISSGKEERSRSTKTSDKKEWPMYLSIAAVSKFVAAIIAYPHEVLRTRLRQDTRVNGEIKYKTLVQSTKLILREEGIGAFYGGLTAHLLRVVPNAAIMFFSYEYLLHWFSS